ncbi:MAG: 30S ribosomal protein S4 [Blastochloris sp.]|jgi:small subunit ribosomal protein S4|nr:30S ribosomal protein S4 [Blastochloris sp.]
MARYTGPRSKISRRFGMDIFGGSKALERRNYPPGVHGQKRRKSSEYGLALAEKQKLKFTYGVLEAQFRRYFEIAAEKRGITGDTLLALLETRLDNVIYRLGFAKTRRLARQFVTHGHAKVNGAKAAIPSFNCKPGDIIEIRANAKSRQIVTTSIDASQLRVVPDWVTVDTTALKGTVVRQPTREEIGINVNERLVVELFSR